MYVAEEACAEQPLVILLDSLEQLAPAYGAHNMAWVPKTCPPNVSIIFTISNEHRHILDNLFVHLANDRTMMLMDEMDLNDCELYAQSILDNNDKLLYQHYQQRIISGDYIRCPYPLMVRILMHDAIRWKSFTLLQHTSALQVEDAVSNFLSRIERIFGTLIIECVCSYISLFSGGLTEIELLDTLSCNDQVLNEVYINHDPSTYGIVRFPYLLWLRIYDELSPYLDERLTDGKTTLCWYHTVFRHTVFKRYMNQGSSSLLKTERYKEVAVIFITENGLKRTITLNRRSLTIPDADRQIMPQKVTPKNLRKLRLLPPLLLASDDFTNVKDTLKELALCNFKWINTKLKVFGYSELLNDYYMINHSDDEIDIVYEFLMSLSDVLRSSPQNLASEIICRLSHVKFNSVRNLCTDARETILSEKKPVLLPKYSCFHNSGSIFLTGPTTILGVNEPRNIVLWSKELGLQIWSLRMREWLFQISNQAQPREIQIDPGSKMLYHIMNTILVVSDIESGAKVTEIDVLPHATVAGKTRGSNDDNAMLVVLSVAHDIFKCVVLVTESQHCIDMKNLLVIDVATSEIEHGIQEVDAVMIAGAHITDGGTKLVVAQTHAHVGNASIIRVYGLGLNTKLMECTLLESIAIMPDHTFLTKNESCCVFPCRPNDLTVCWTAKNAFKTFIESEKDTSQRMIDAKPLGESSVLVLSYDVESCNSSLTIIDVDPESEDIPLNTNMISDAGQPLSMSVSLDEVFACVTYTDNGIVELWHLNKRRLFKVIFTEHKDLTGCMFIGDKKILAIGSGSNVITLLNITESLRTSDNVNHITEEFNDDHCDNVNSFVVYDNDRYLLTTYDTHTPVVWNINTGKVINQLKTPEGCAGVPEVKVIGDLIYGLAKTEGFITTSILRVSILN